MSLRLVKLLVSTSSRDRAYEILDDHNVTARWAVTMEGERLMIEMVLPGEGNEPILDDLENAFRDQDGFRLLFFPLEAAVPRIGEVEEEDEADDAPSSMATGDGEQDEDNGKKKPKAFSRVNREELYTNLSDSAEPSTFYMAMVALSAVVASAGLIMGDGAVIIGAMVIAPLIGPSLAVAFATTLGDLKLGRRAITTSILGAVIAFGLSLLVGWVVTVDPEGSEVISRTRLTFGHLALALAAGAAGALAMTRGAGTGLVGVMVAVALLPPLANSGLLLGAGYLDLGLGALLLVAGNLVCLNLAATAVFLILGIRPNIWWEDEARRKAIWIAGLLWGSLLVVMVLLVVFFWGGEGP